MTSIRMEWPIKDPTVSLADVRRQAVADMAREAHDQEHRLVGPPLFVLERGTMVGYGPARPYLPRPYKTTTKAQETADPIPVCALHHDPDMWVSDEPAVREIAAGICRRECPLIEECAVDAIARKTEFGVYGGLDFGSKEAKRARRRAARNRTAGAA